jgi:hypothetical protein
VSPVPALACLGGWPLSFKKCFQNSSTLTRPGAGSIRTLWDFFSLMSP